MKDGYILLCPNAHRDYGLESTLAISSALRERGHEVHIAPFLSDGLENTWSPDIPTECITDALPGARLVVSLGGDGTILQLSRYLAGSGIPILGVNLGNKGFLAELEQTETDCILAVADGHYTVQPRMMLDLKLFRGGKLVYCGSALNEAVVRASVSVVRLEAFSDGREITAFSGDGIIVATPTGSTAYSMAAGGPIVEPCANCIILTPICTFRLAARSYVLKEDREVFIRTIDQGDKEVILSVDGVPVPFLDGDELLVSRSEKTLLMARVKDRSFFDIVFEKLVDK